MEWKTKIIEKWGTLLYDVIVYQELGNHKVEYVKPDGTYEVMDTRSAVSEVTMSLTKGHLQALANALDKMGVSPAKEYTEGKLEATESHLADMRKLLKLK